VIEGARVALRPLGEKDAGITSCWESEYYAATVPGNGRNRHLSESQGQGNKGGAKTARMFAIEAEDGTLIGSIGLVEISWRKSEAELVVLIGDERYRGRGYGTEAVNTLLEYAFNHTKLARVYLRVFQENTSAIRCFEKCGFRKEWVVTRKFEDGGPSKKVILMTLDRKGFIESSRCQAAS